MMKKLLAFSYVEVLIAMVIISAVFTIFINMAYSAVHRAKILEARDLMENYAYSLLESFGDALAVTSGTQSGFDIWRATGNFFIDKLKIKGNLKEILAITTCSISENGKYLNGGCALANDVLANADERFGYYFHVEPVSPGKVIKVTVVLGCVQENNTRSCRGEELPPIKINKFYTNYGQEK